MAAVACFALTFAISADESTTLLTGVGVSPCGPFDRIGGAAAHAAVASAPARKAPSASARRRDLHWIRLMFFEPPCPCSVAAAEQVVGVRAWRPGAQPASRIP